MKFTLRLPAPTQTDLGLVWLFNYRGFPCKLVRTESSLKLRMDDKEIEPSRVLREDEMDDWRELQEPYVLEYGGLSEDDAPYRVMRLIVEVILRRYADVLEGIAPPGFNNQ